MTRERNLRQKKTKYSIFHLLLFFFLFVSYLLLSIRVWPCETGVTAAITSLHSQNWVVFLGTLLSFFVCFFLVFISFVDRVAAGGRLTASVITRRIERRRSCGCGDVRRRARWTTLVVCGPLSTGGKKKTKSDRGDFHWVPTRSVFRPWRIFCFVFFFWKEGGLPLLLLLLLLLLLFLRVNVENFLRGAPQRRRPCASNGRPHWRPT